MQLNYGGYILRTSTTMVDLKEEVVSRSWKERLLSRPWKPWVKVKTIYYTVPSSALIIWENRKMIYCHPAYYEEVKETLLKDVSLCSHSAPKLLQ